MYIFINILVLLFAAQTSGACPYLGNGTFCDPNIYIISNQTYNLCYLYNNDSNAIWIDAQQYCDSISWSMVSIHNAFENANIRNQLRNLTSSTIWIGASDMVGECIEFGRDCKFFWDDGSSFNYSNFAIPVQPDGEHYVSMNVTDGKWYAVDEFSGERYPFLCHKYVPTTPEMYKCPSGAFPNRNTSLDCYDYDCYLYNETKLDWQSAEGACIQQGGHLAEIFTLQQNEIIQSNLPSLTKNQTERVWIGLWSREYEYIGNGNYDWRWNWAGSQDWLNGTWNNFSNFNPNYDIPNAGLTGTFDISNGQWYSSQNSTKFSFLCKVPLVHS